MSEETEQMIIEFETGTGVVQVNRAAFDEHMELIDIDFEKSRTDYITYLYDTSGKYVGSHTGFCLGKKDNYTKYYIPKER